MREGKNDGKKEEGCLPPTLSPCMPASLSLPASLPACLSSCSCILSPPSAPRLPDIISAPLPPCLFSILLSCPLPGREEGGQVGRGEGSQAGTGEAGRERGRERKRGAILDAKHLNSKNCRAPAGEQPRSGERE